MDVKQVPPATKPDVVITLSHDEADLITHALGRVSYSTNVVYHLWEALKKLGYGIE